MTVSSVYERLGTISEQDAASGISMIIRYPGVSDLSIQNKFSLGAGPTPTWPALRDDENHNGS